MQESGVRREAPVVRMVPVLLLDECNRYEAPGFIRGETQSEAL